MKKITRFRISPDDGQSKDWMVLRVWRTRREMEEEAGERCRGYFLPPWGESKIGSGVWTGSINLPYRCTLRTLVHEITHAGHFYASNTGLENQRRKVFDNFEEEQDWMIEAVAHCTDSIFQQVYEAMKSIGCKLG